MRRFRRTSLCGLVLCAIAGGCSATPDYTYLHTPISEYRTTEKPADFVPEHAAVVSLWRCEPGTFTDENGPIDEPSRELRRVSIDGRDAVGFRNKNGHVVAIAGTSALQLPPGHYVWYLMAEDPHLTVWPDYGNQFYACIDMDQPKPVVGNDSQPIVVAGR